MTQAPMVSVTTRVMPHEVHGACAKAVQRLFPDFLVETEPDSAGFPIARDPTDLRVEGVAPDLFLEMLGKQRILDTALDAMSQNLRRNSTSFLLSRQAALKGKVAFVLASERTVGGVISVELEGADLIDWLEEATHHPGRLDVPRNVGDDVSMLADGGVTEWFDAKGRATMQTDDQD
jgi:predicted RNA binding protein with dsRBD fold (UPF0201 family)